MPRRLTPEQQIAVDAIRKIEADLIDTYRRLSLGITNDVRFHRRSIDRTEQLRILRRTDNLLNPVFGATRDLVPDGELYRLITSTMDDTAEKVLLHNLDRMHSLVDARDPTLWQKLESKILFGPQRGEEAWQYLVRMQNGDAAARSRLLRSQKLDPQRRWVPKDRWNTKRGYRLSDRLWNQKRAVQTQINRMIRDAVAEGLDPLTLADELERYLNHAAGSSTYTTPDGRVIRINQTDAPRSGWGNVNTRRLAVTEVQRINAAAALEASTITPGSTGVKYALSNSHVKIDECDKHAAGRSEGMGPGEYIVKDAPLIPNHPWCVCTYILVFDQSDQWIDDLVAKYLSESEVA